MSSIEKLKQLREETGISMMECKKALEQAKGDIKRAKEILRKKGKDFAEKRVQRETGQGIVASYVHNDKRLGCLLDLRCESDFVARADDFQKLAKELCLQIAAMEPDKVADLLAQPWIKDEARSVKELIDEYVAKLGENIKVEKFVRYEI